MAGKRYPETPDGRYFVARNRLWRCTDPRLEVTVRRRWVSTLMTARRAVRDATDAQQTRRARARVNEAKIALGERGPVWWTDGAPDETRLAPATSSYAEWWANLDDDTRKAGGG